jgi:histone-lysine N-methyltransferase SETD3
MWVAPRAQAFPVFRDRMPVQLLAYLRLARLTDTALLAKVRRA